jgi:hypothetical protein
MTKKLPITIALAVLALLSLAFVRPAPTQWEYKDSIDFRKANQLGAEGWELAAVDCGNAVCRYLYKRPKQ